MLKQVTKKFIEVKNACAPGLDFFNKYSEKDPIKFLHLLMQENNYSWANWLVVRLMDKSQCLRYVKFVAKVMAQPVGPLAEHSAKLAAEWSEWSEQAAAEDGLEWWAVAAAGQVADHAAHLASRSAIRLSERAADQRGAARAAENEAYEKYVKFGIDLLTKGEL